MRSAQKQNGRVQELRISRVDRQLIIRRVGELRNRDQSNGPDAGGKSRKRSNIPADSRPQGSVVLTKRKRRVVHISELRQNDSESSWRLALTPGIAESRR